jgi:putative glutamine amidotransferase
VSSSQPVVLVPACNRLIGPHPYHYVGRKYTEAVRLAGCLPLIVPGALPEEFDPLLDLVDGVLLTGSPSNVHPSHFEEAVHDPSLPLDPDRDAWTLPLIPRALARGIPFFAICRGTQETNVALGGSLHQAVHEVEGHLDHREDDDDPLDDQYGPAHPVEAVPGGLLARIVGSTRFEVNSLHGQAVKRLADGLIVEARAPDGVIEAFSMPGARGFNLAVQWHPEWRAASNPVSMSLLRAFGEACADWRERKTRGNR